MSTRPNILMIVCDQLTCAVLQSFAGEYNGAPHIDKLAQGGVRFTRTYTHTPLCQPARAAMWTGLYPHQSGILSNGHGNGPRNKECIDPTLPTLGKLFTQAGYHAVHFGKTHDKGALAGFEIDDPAGQVELPPTRGYPMNQDSFCDVYTTQKSCAFLESYGSSHGKSPYLAVVDLINPHNICQWVGENMHQREETLSAEQDAQLPKLPANFTTEDFDQRPLPVRYLCCMHRRQAQSANWSEATYRRYIDAYQHYTSMVDAQVGQVLAALAKRDDADNTMILLTADHGDGLTSHRVATKHTAFYENITRVPLVLSGPGLTQPQANTSLASLADVLPTLCDVAGIEVPVTCVGRSLLAQAKGQATKDWREFVVSQWYTDRGDVISPGRMIRSDRYKYTHYLEGNGEELFDLQNDPGETRTLHADPAYAAELQRHRAMLQSYLKETDDPYLSYDVFVPDECRAHPSGYEHHHLTDKESV